MGQLRQPLLDASIIGKGDYEYSVRPVSGDVLMLEPGLLREIVIKIIRRANLESVNKIVTSMVMGIRISMVVSLVTDIPLTVIRRHEYGLDDEVSLHQQTGCPEGNILINDVNEDDCILVLNDVLSTGGMIKAVFDVFDHTGADVVNTVVIIEKAGPNEFNNSDHHIKTLINVTVEDGGVVIVDEYGDN